MQEAQKWGKAIIVPEMVKPIRSKPAPTPPPAKVAFTFDTAAIPVSVKIIELLKTELIPLIKCALPDPQDLKPFWGKVTRALRSLDPTYAYFE
jgi:hypothetical protein